MLSPEVLATAKRHGTRIWINSLWASLNAGHEDAKALAGDIEGSWGWILDHGATIIQTDHRAPLAKYLEAEGKRSKAP
jgi:glycerophosphoryl diester phosphodiesterase